MSKLSLKDAYIQIIAKEFALPLDKLRPLTLEVLDNLTKEESISVDIFISNEVNPSTLDFFVGAPKQSSLITVTPKGKKIEVDGFEVDESTLATLIQEQKEIIQRRIELKTIQRAKNRKKLLQILSTLTPKANKLLATFDPNKDHTILTVTLPKSKFITLLKLLPKGIVSDIDIHRPLSPSSTQASQAFRDWINLRNWYMSQTSVDRSGYEGDNIGIYYSDAKCFDTKSEIENHPMFMEKYINNIPYRAYEIPYLYKKVGDEGNIDNTIHAKMVTGVLATVARKACLYCNNALIHKNNKNIFYSDVLPTVQMKGEAYKVNVESYSLNAYKYNNEYKYFALDKTFDNHLYDYRHIPIFISAGNTYADDPLPYVLSPAKAYNILSVGGYQKNSNNHTLSISLWDGSRYLDPFTALINDNLSYIHNKPEVIAPAKDFYYFYYDKYNNSQEKAGSGTSFATPWTAAIAARVMSQGSFWKHSAAVIKSTIIAGATDKYTGELKNNNNYRSIGAVDLKSSLMYGGYQTYAAYWYDYNKDRPFSNWQGKKCASPNWTFHLDGGKSNQRLVLSWLVKIDNTDFSRIPQSYSFHLVDEYGNEIAQANNKTTNFQVINLSHKSGKYHIKICENWNDNDGRFDIGVSLMQK